MKLSASSTLTRNTLGGLLAILLFPAATPSAMAQTGVAQVTVTQVRIGPLPEEVRLSGSVLSRRFSRLSPRVDGLVADVLVDAGDKVVAGAPLLKLDSSLAAAALASAAAALEAARVNQADAERRRDEAADLVRQKNVAETTYKSVIAEAEIAAAATAQREADLRREKELLRRHTLESPFSGYITDKLAETGEWVRADTPVLELIDPDSLRVEVNVPQKYYGRIGVGTGVSVDFDDGSVSGTRAIVSGVVPRSSLSARSFPVLINLDRQGQAAAPGESVQVTIFLQSEQRQRVMQLPLDAVLRRPDGSAIVWRVDRSAAEPTVESVRVSTGLSARGQIEIKGDSISPGDTVVLRGNENMRPGQTIAIQED